MTEAELQQKIIAICEEKGLLVHWEPDSRRLCCDRGFPDLTIAGPHGVIFAELKSDSGTLTPAQRRWQYRLLSSGQTFVVWRPGHLEGSIRYQLGKIA